MVVHYVVGGTLERLFGEVLETAVPIEYAAPTRWLVHRGCDACARVTEKAIYVRHRESNLECSAACRVETFAKEPMVIYSIESRQPTNFRVAQYIRGDKPRRGSVVLEYIRTASN